MNRRHFLRNSAVLATLAGAGGLPSCVLGQTDRKSRVVLVRNMDMATEKGEEAINRMLTQMVHESVRALAGKGKSREEAWRQFIRPDDIVGVKINGLSPPMSSHPAVAFAVGQGAGFCGVKPNNVVVFDKEDRDLTMSGYTVNREGEGIQVYGTATDGGSAEMPYERQKFRRETAYRLSKIVSRTCTALVNVPVIKDHAWAGMTCALKNHFGSIDNPNQFHKIDSCGPAIVDVNRDANIRDKQRLIICDARAIQYDGGPSFKPQFLQPYYAVLAATDPVAMDVIAMELIEMCRTQQALPKLMEREYKPIHVAEAAREGLGICDRAKIEVVVKELGSGAKGS